MLGAGPRGPLTGEVRGAKEREGRKERREEEET